MPGGVGDYTRRLAGALAARGHTSTVLTIAGERFQIVRSEAPGTPPSQLPRADAGWGWRMWRDVIVALLATRPDILHIQYQTGAYGMHPAVNFLPWRLRSVPGRPAVVVTAHDLLPPYLFPKAGPLRAWVTRRLLVDADAAVVTNDEDLVRLVDPRPPTEGACSPSIVRRSSTPLHVIPIGSNIPVAPPPGYDRDAWRARLGIAPHETLVAYFGLISRSKGLDTLLDALTRLPATVRLLVIGGEAAAPQDVAFAEEVRARLAATPALRSRVTITGYCPEAEVSAHLLAADLAALPFADGASFRRGSLLAALAHGLPVVTTVRARGQEAEAREQQPEVGAYPLAAAWLQLQAAALFVPAGDAAALAGALERLAGDAALRAALGAAGRTLAAHFSWEMVAMRHEAVYHALRIVRLR